MKQPIIGQKVNDEAIDSLIDLLEEIADADAVFYVGYPVAASVDSPITVPALLISEKFGLVCFDVVPSANGGDIPALKLKQRSIVLALKAKLLLHPDLADDDDLAVKVNCITYALATDHDANLMTARIADPDNLAEALGACAKILPKYHGDWNGGRGLDCGKPAKIPPHAVAF